MKGKYLHITAATEAAKLEGSGSRHQRGLKVLKRYSSSHPLQIWHNAYRPQFSL